MARRISKAEISEILEQGCDERVHIVEGTNRNKYHLNPVQYETLLQRGTCTANLLTRRSHGVAKAFLGKYDELNYENV